jgi:tetratricopeptide (TPR) repeat protein
MARRVPDAELFDFTSCLTEELRHQTDTDRRISLLFALIRRLEDRSEESTTVRALIDEISRLCPDDPDLIWERWRSCFRFDSKERLKALSDIKEILEFPDDIVHAHVIRAEIIGEHLFDHARALKEVDTVKRIAPGRAEAFLASAQTRAAAGRPIAEWAEELEIFADKIADPSVVAALLFEIAELKRLFGRDPADVSDLLFRALSLAGADWTVVDGAFRIAEKIEDARLMEAAARKLAEAACSSSDESPADRPQGHGFLGFERGDEIAAAYYWLLALIRERLLKDPEAALSAMERAQSLLPKNRLLKLERARLLCVLGKQEDAFAAVPEDTSFLELAIFAYLAGKHEEASYLASLEREHAPSLFSEIVFESFCDDTSPPPMNAPPSVLEYWFDGRPDHEDAGKIADTLRPNVSSSSLVRLFLEENAPQDCPIVDVVDSGRKEPWSYALSALLGEESDRFRAFENWANTVSDPVLKSTLLQVAALLQQEEEGEPAAAPMERAAASSRDSEDVNDPLQGDAIGELGEEEKLISLIEQAIRLSVDSGDHQAAAEILKQAADAHPDDLAIRLLLLNVACRTKDFPSVADGLFAVISRAQDDAKKMLLSLGEINLLLHKDLKAALSYFDEAERLNGDISGMARIFRLLTLHLLNEEEAIQKALEESAGRQKGVPHDFFDWEEEEEAGLSAAALLEDKDNLPLHKNVVSILSAFADDGRHAASKIPAASVAAFGLRRLGGQLSEDEHPAAYFTAAALLDGKFDAVPIAAASLDTADERLIHLDEKVIFENGMTEQLEARGRRIKSSDIFEWVDWMLSAAEAAAESEGPSRALEIIHEGLAVAPEHPGLLEAEVLFANSCGEYEEAADTRGRLARLYVSKDEKVHQLVQAALILFDKLQDPKGARNILNEAKRRNPGHAEANEVWQYVQHAAHDSVDSQESQDEGAGRREDVHSKKTSVESLERKISKLIGINQLDAAMEEVNKLLIRFPDRLSAHRTRLDLLTRAKRWEQAVAAAEAYFNAATHQEERRSIVFRAAAIADDVLKDPTLAIAWMQRLREVGDSFPEADRRMREIADKAGIALDEEAFFEEDGENNDTLKSEEGE